MKFLTNFIILLSVVFLGWCSYFLYKELTSRVERKGGNVIGTVVFKKKNASRRYNDSVIWEEIAQESEIYNYDAIRTMEYSSATLTLKNGTRIELDQNTMLVVIMDDKSLNINFDKGGVTAQNIADTGGEVTLNSKDASIQMGKGDISVSSDDSGTNIQLNSGTAKVAAGGKELSIASNEIAVLKGGVAETTKENITLEYPGRNMNIVSFDKTKPVNFSWKSSAGFFDEVKLEISHNSSFRPLFKSISTRKSGYQVDLPAGDYYWRVTKGKTKSRQLKFSILADSRPELSTPYKNQKIVLTEGAGMVTFRWNKSRYAVNYEVTAARDSSMKEKVLELNSRINIISTAALEPGAYYWKVRSVYPQGITTDSAEIEPVSFSVEKREFTMARPVPLDQGPVTTGGDFNLSWKGVEGAKKYNVEISTDPEFKNIKVKKIPANTFAKISEKIIPGGYFWRVNAIRGEKISEWSETAHLTVTEPVQISAVYPADGAILYEKPASIRFSWSDPNRGSDYSIELSSSRDFRSIKTSRETQSAGINIDNPGEGVFFWRVKLKDKTGRIIAQSRVSDFTIPADLKIPVQISPKDNEKIKPGVKKRLSLQWKKVEGANEYEVEMFQRIAGVEKSLSIYTTKKTSIDLANQILYKPGNFSWMVRAKKMKNGKITAYKESAKSFFEIEEVAFLPAPVVKSPQILFNAK